MTTETPAAFARRLGWTRGGVSLANKNGRLAMVGNLIDVEASMERLKETESRPWLTERNAENRAAKQAKQQANTLADPIPVPPPPQIETSIGNSYQSARAVKEKYAALKVKADYEALIGKLVPREVVDAVLLDYGSTLRSLLEIQADRLAPIVFALQTFEEIHSALSAADEAILNEMADLLQRKAEAFDR